MERFGRYFNESEYLEGKAAVVIISSIRGIIGMFIGIIGAYIIENFAGITPVGLPFAIIGVVIFSSAVGIFFGIYSAKKVAQLNPIEVLRYE